MKAIDLMQLTARFEFINNHTWRAPYHRLISDVERDSIGDIMVEAINGRYVVARIQEFHYPAHTSYFTGAPIAAADDIQSSYFDKSFSHNQLAKAFEYAVKMSATPITTITINQTDI